MVSNDAIIIFGFLLFFVISGSLLAFVNSELTDEYETTDNTIIEDAAKKEMSISSTLTLPNLLFEIAKMSFYTFGSLPAVLDIIFIPLRLVFWFIVGRNVLGSGG